MVSTELPLVTPTNSIHTDHPRVNNPLQEFSPEWWAVCIPVTGKSHIIPDGWDTAAL